MGPKTDEIKATMKNDVYQWRRALHVPVLIVLQVRTIYLLYVANIMQSFVLHFARVNYIAGHVMVLKYYLKLPTLGGNAKCLPGCQILI